MIQNPTMLWPEVNVEHYVEELLAKPTLTRGTPDELVTNSLKTTTTQGFSTEGIVKS